MALSTSYPKGIGNTLTSDGDRRATGGKALLVLGVVDAVLQVYALVPPPPFHGIGIVAFPLLPVILVTYAVLLVAILAFPHVVTAFNFDKNHPANQQYFAVSPRVRWEYGLLYVGLIAFLAYMTNAVDSQLHGISRQDTEQTGSGDV